MLKILKATLCALLIVSAILLFCSCKDNDTASLSSDTSDETVSIEPATIFFPDSYINLVAEKEGFESIKVQSNMGVKITKDVTKTYNAISLESADIESTYKTINGFGVGSDCTEFLNNYGLTHGFCLVTDKDGNSVDILEVGKNTAKVTAILSLNSDGTVSYIPAANIALHLNGINSSNLEYIKNADIGNDLLVIEITSKNGETVDTFELIHYTNWNL